MSVRKQRPVAVCFKITEQSKKQFDELVALMSKEIGTQLSQTQVLEKVIRDAYESRKGREI